MRCTSGNAPRGCMGTIRNSQFPSPRQYQSTVHRTDRGHEMNESPVRLSLFERREKSVSAPTELCALGTALCAECGVSRVAISFWDTLIVHRAFARCFACTPQVSGNVGITCMCDVGCNKPRSGAASRSAHVRSFRSIRHVASSRTRGIKRECQDARAPT